ncbi:hypothetical protein D9758_010569 [Tetrapyrgos nigripes]|uniref:Uncharacterized protein n=1 Tax=Tetrapyrgos nigripes TaxID=182062 RepID=A0A8H5D5A5_9AGAR|nr:hypothetical protein D9758_010569 [Tetrapyrgos nigripes]
MKRYLSMTFVSLYYPTLWRAIKTGRDLRFDEFKKKPLTFTSYWMIQATWTFLCPPSLGPYNYAIFSLFAVLFLFENIADYHKSTWRHSKELKQQDDKFISIGLWGVSRHPNLDILKADIVVSLSLPKE